MPTQVFEPGRVGVVSRSGTLTYQIWELGLLGIGQSTVVGIGGDPVVGSGFIDVLERFEADPDTDLVVMVGEIGGTRGERGRLHRVEHVDAVVAYVAGAPGKQMGHAGAIITGSSGTAQAKKEALEARGVRVGQPDRGRLARGGGSADGLPDVDLAGPVRRGMKRQIDRRKMSKLVVTESVSVDGVMQAPGGPNEDTDAARLGRAPTSTTRMGGRRSRAHPPRRPACSDAAPTRSSRPTGRVTGDDPIAAKLNAMPKHVARARSRPSSGTTRPSSRATSPRRWPS